MLHPFVWKVCVNTDAFDAVVKAELFDQAKGDAGQPFSPEIAVERHPVYDCAGLVCVPFSLNIVVSRFPVKIDTQIPGDPVIFFYHVSFLRLNVLPDRVQSRIVFGSLRESLFLLEISPHLDDL